MLQRFARGASASRHHADHHRHGGGAIKRSGGTRRLKVIGVLLIGLSLVGFLSLRRGRREGIHAA